MKKKIGIITDSSSGLTKEDFINFPNIGFSPLLINFNNKETIKDDPQIFEEKDLIKRIKDKKEIAKTSQTPLGEVMQAWEKMLSEYEKIIVISLSKGLSGQYNTALILAKEPQFENKVFVFDSNGVSRINYLLVMKANELINNGEEDIDKIFDSLSQIRDNYLAFILPNDINYLARGGRLSKTAAALAKSLKLIPILSFDGTIDKYDTTRTWKKAVNKALHEIDKFQKKSENEILLYVLNALAEEESINEVLNYVKSFNFKKIKVVKLPNVITCHTGLGAFSFLAFNLNEEQLPKNI